jgi:polysaccharide pyruvyl transferase WcaK-like protein
LRKKQFTKISLFGHFGSLNFGNESTLLAMVSRLRVTFPNCELSCICTGPEQVIAAHRIEAVPHTDRSVRIWDRRFPLGKRMRMAFLGLREEAGEYIRAWRALKGTGMFIVPGTGLLTDAFGLSGWGPYGLLKWTVVAKLRRSRVMFVSVGAGPIDSSLGRFFARWALSLADYRSYRDAPSKEVVKGLGVRAADDGVFPTTAERVRDGRRIVALGLMAYSEKYSVTNPTGGTYQRYLESLGTLVDWLLDHGYDVKLLLGDVPVDRVVIGDLRALVRKRLEPGAEERVSYHEMGSLDDLLLQLSSADLVVATRFHNVLTSLLVHKPVIAISFHHKCSSLMSCMGLSDYCLDINRINPDQLVAKFEALEQHGEELERAIRLRVEEAQAALEEQYELVFHEEIVASEALQTETARA